MGGTIRQIPLDLLDASPFNPRKTFDEAELAGLAQSIREIGISQPLIVRPLEIEGLVEPRFEIVAGHRRSEAATLAGLEEVPCIVRELNDAAARELALIDNLQRVDVPAMEEAEAFGALLESMAGIPAVALRVGKDLAYVAKRLKLRGLGVWQRDALNAKLIMVDHALLLARLGIAEQDAALKWCLDRNAGVKTPVDKVVKDRIDGKAGKQSWRFAWEPESVQRLKGHIEEHSGRKLARAPWALDDAQLLPDAGACAACPSNTNANVALFADLDIEEATCADGGCFELKRAAFVQIALKSAALWPGKPGEKLPLRVSWKETSTEPRFENGVPCDGPKGLNNFTKVPKRTQILKAGQWVEAKKNSCAHVEAAVTVDWSDANDHGYMGSGKKLRKPGEVLAVCAAPKCKAHPKAYEKAARPAAGGERYDPKAEAEKEAKREAAAIEESKLRMAVVSHLIDGIKEIPAEGLRHFIWDAASRDGRELAAAAAILRGCEKALKTAKVASIEFAKAATLAMVEELVCRDWQGPDASRGEFLASVKRLGWTGPDPWKKAAAKPAAKKAAPKKAAKKAGRK